MAAERPESNLQEPPSKLSKGGVNIFQEIKAVCKEARENGVELIDLSIGQPEGYPLEVAMEKGAEALRVKEQRMYDYQDNGEQGIPGFSQRFVAAHLRTSVENANVAYLPTPGTKNMLTLFSLACGGQDRKLTIAMMTNPGYPTPKTWAGSYFHHNIYELPLNPENQFRFSVSDIPEGIDLVMINYPHNPSGQVATLEQLEELCQHCQDKGIRLVNDAAYMALSHTKESYSLTDVAVNFPGLSWMELFSSSKTIGNATSFRIGAAVGSPIFIEDFGKIKGNTDSGFNPALATGVLYAVENDKAGIEQNRLMYERRIKILTSAGSENGLRPAVEPAGGFFTLWISPKFAFGEQMENAADFNNRMINETGIVGIPFDPYIRYAVTTEDVETKSEEIAAGFRKAQVSY